MPLTGTDALSLSRPTFHSTKSNEISITRLSKECQYCGSQSLFREEGWQWSADSAYRCRQEPRYCRHRIQTGRPPVGIPTFKGDSGTELREVAELRMLGRFYIFRFCISTKNDIYIIIWIGFVKYIRKYFICFFLCFYF